MIKMTPLKVQWVFSALLISAYTAGTLQRTLRAITHSKATTSLPSTLIRLLLLDTYMVIHCVLALYSDIFVGD